MNAAILASLLLLGTPPAPLQAAPALPKLSDADVLAIARSGYDKVHKMGHRDVLGIHDGITLVADYPCSDNCPIYTTRVIHYALPPDESCTRGGGVIRQRLVPVSIAMVNEPFCVPAVIADDD